MAKPIFAEREQLLLVSLRQQLANRWNTSSSKTREYIRHTVNHLRFIREMSSTYEGNRP